MKNILKQSVIGALYLFSIASFGAVVVITLYALAGKQYIVWYVYVVRTYASPDKDHVRCYHCKCGVVGKRTQIALHIVYNYKASMSIYLYPHNIIPISIQGKFLKIQRTKRREKKKKFGYPRIYTYIYVIIKVI